MTLSDADRAAIVIRRLGTAAEMLGDAEVLLDRGSLRSSANQAYYAAFHAVSALAVNRSRALRNTQGNYRVLPY